MQAVVLTSSLAATTDPAHPDYACCQVKEVSAPFTVPANQVTTVPLALHVSATEAANLSLRGDTSTGDGVGISILDPNASLPVRPTEDPADAILYWAPALTAPTTSFVASGGDKLGYELSALFTFAEAAAGKGPIPTPGPSPTGKPGPAAKAGVKLHGGALRPAGDGKTLTLGKATNPPTASTRQTLTLPGARASAADGKFARSVVLGVGKTMVPSGRSASLKLALNSKARAMLAGRRSLKATLKIVATNARGEAQTLTRVVTVEPAKKRRR
jgi:hypothetical protein